MKYAQNEKPSHESGKILCMGRGGDEGEYLELASLQDDLRNLERRVGVWEMRMNREASSNPATIEELMSTRSHGLRQLTQSPRAQKEMIRIIRELQALQECAPEALRVRAQKAENRAREMFVLCHRGYVEQKIFRHVQRLDSESPESAREVFQQACDIGLHRTIDRYDLDSEANPLTYATKVILHEIKKEAEAGRRIRLKSKANMLGDKIEQIAKEIEDSGKPVTYEEIAKAVDETPARVAEILPHARREHIFLDAEVSTDSGSATIGSLTSDNRVEIERGVLDDQFARALRTALADLPTLERSVIEISFGFDGSSDRQQKDLFDGVYRDSQGRAFSAKDSVIREWKKRGETVEKRGQHELNDLYRCQKLLFEAGNPSAYALARAARGYSADDPGERLLNYKTGIPATPGTVQEALRRGLESLSTHRALQDLEIRYRGPNALENSARARQEVRQELLDRKIISETDLPDLQKTRSAAGGKSQLRLLAEKHGLLDPDSGSLQ